MQAKLLEDAEGHLHHYVICKNPPIPVEIGSILDEAPTVDNPHLFEDPHEHWCGQGRWWDKDEGQWITKLDAEDVGDDHVDRHAFSALKGEQL
jgi:hypothetical protein